MRLVFGIVSLLIALVVVGLLAKKQLGAVPVPKNPEPASQAATAPGGPEGPKIPPRPSQQIQEQVRQSVEAAMQRPRTVDGE